MKKVISAALLAFMIIFSNHSASFAEIAKPPEKSREELYHNMFISLLLPEIQKPIYKYYSRLITDYPSVYPYSVDVISVKRSNMHYVFLVVVEVTPVVGPHVSLGKDRLTFRIIPGHAKLLKFEHLKTDELPKKRKHILRSGNE